MNFLMDEIYTMVEDRSIIDAVSSIDQHFCAEVRRAI